MDAKRNFCLLLLFPALILTGCEWFTARPAARPEEKPEEQQTEAPIVVSNATPDAPEPAPDAGDETIDTQVAQYIARVDDLATRVTARPPQHGAAARRPRDSSPPAVDLKSPASDVPDPEPADPPPASLPAPETPIRAPRLDGVAVRAADPPGDVASSGPRSTAAPRVNGPIEAGSNVPGGLREILDALPASGENASFRQQLDQRIAQVVAGEYEKAREPLTLVSNDQQTMAARFIEALIAVRSGHIGDPAAANTAALAAIDQLSAELRRGSDLRLPTVAICSAVSGFGQYQPIEPPVFTAGVESEFVLYVEVGDFVSEKQDDGFYQTRFDLRTAVLNRAGDTAFEHLDSDVVDRCRNRRNDCFIPRLVQLPATLSPGEYVVKVTVTDKLGKKVAENRATIRVAAGGRGSPG